MQNASKYQTPDLFLALMKELKPDLICDIGCRDGREAMLFANYSPRSKVVAFEANPFLYKRLNDDKQFTSKVELRSEAVSNQKGEAHFYVTKEDFENSANSITAGQSSLLADASKDCITVKTVRVDELYSNSEFEHIMLWIDVEGHAYEVLEGIEGIKEKVKCIHVEVENKVYWEGQKLKTDVVKLLASYDFSPLFDNATKHVGQADVIFIHNSVRSKRIKRIKLQADLWRILVYPFKIIGLHKLEFIDDLATKIRHKYLIK